MAGLFGFGLLELDKGRACAQIVLRKTFLEKVFLNVPFQNYISLGGRILLRLQDFPLADYGLRGHLAQLVRALRSHRKGQRFKSSSAHQFNSEALKRFELNSCRQIGLYDKY